MRLKLPKNKNACDDAGQIFGASINTTRAMLMGLGAMPNPVTKGLAATALANLDRLNNVATGPIQNTEVENTLVVTDHANMFYDQKMYGAIIPYYLP